jgi:hypothetical protein
MSGECLLLAQSGHLDCVEGCPLSGVKRTSKFKSVTSAFDPTRTWGAACPGADGPTCLHPSERS